MGLVQGLVLPLAVASWRNVNIQIEHDNLLLQRYHKSIFSPLVSQAGLLVVVWAVMSQK